MTFRSRHCHESQSETKIATSPHRIPPKLGSVIRQGGCATHPQPPPPKHNHASVYPLTQTHRRHSPTRLCHLHCHILSHLAYHPWPSTIRWYHIVDCGQREDGSQKRLGAEYCRTPCTATVHTVEARQRPLRSERRGHREGQDWNERGRFGSQKRTTNYHFDGS